MGNWLSVDFYVGIGYVHEIPSNASHAFDQRQAAIGARSPADGLMRYRGAKDGNTALFTMAQLVEYAGHGVGDIQHHAQRLCGHGKHRQ